MSSKEIEEEDYYNLPLASLTFGRSDQKHFSEAITSTKTKDENISSKIENPSNSSSANPNNSANTYTTHHNYNLPMNIENKNKQIKQSNNSNVQLAIPKRNYTTFLNEINNHHSFLAVIIHSIYNMEYLRNYIIEECPINKDPANKWWFIIRNTILKYSENKCIDLTSLHLCLSELFQRQKRFLLGYPDDPCDLYYVFINSLHSFFMNTVLNEINEENCKEKCFSHRNMWWNITRIDECECKESVKKVFSNYHNYILDIPIEQVFDAMNCVIINVAESNSNWIKWIPKQPSHKIKEYNGKWFMYYKFWLNKSTVDCPGNGGNCQFNKMQSKLILNNTPQYWIVSLKNNHLNFSVTDLLKTIILIPGCFSSSTLFTDSINYSSNLIGIILIRATRIYTCLFKTKNENSKVFWIYYQDEETKVFVSWFEVIKYLMKSGDIPILVIYGNDQMKVSLELNKEDLGCWEQYAINVDNAGKIWNNSLRKQGNLLASNVENNKLFNNNTIFNNNSNMWIQKKNSISSSSNNNKQQQVSHTTPQKIIMKSKDDMKNVEINHNNKQGSNSGYSSLKKLKHNNMNIKRKNNVNNEKNTIIKTHEIINNMHQNSNIKPKQYEDPRARKYYDMPRPFIPKKEIPVTLKAENISPQSISNEQSKPQVKQEIRDINQMIHIGERQGIPTKTNQQYSRPHSSHSMNSRPNTAKKTQNQQISLKDSNKQSYNHTFGNYEQEKKRPRDNKLIKGNTKSGSKSAKHYTKNTNGIKYGGDITNIDKDCVASINVNYPIKRNPLGYN